MASPAMSSAERPLMRRPLSPPVDFYGSSRSSATGASFDAGGGIRTRERSPPARGSSLGESTLAQGTLLPPVPPGKPEPPGKSEASFARKQVKRDTVAVPPETRYARSGDVNVAYQVTGEGPVDIVYVDVISHLELVWEVPSHAAFLGRLALSVPTPPQSGTSSCTLAEYSDSLLAPNLAGTLRGYQLQAASSNSGQLTVLSCRRHSRMGQRVGMLPRGSALPPPQLPGESSPAVTSAGAAGSRVWRG